MKTEAMKKIVLLRHGESVWNRENRFTGWTDVDLSERGEAEAPKPANCCGERDTGRESLCILSETGREDP